MIETHNRDGVLEIIINNPPVNALSAPVREALLGAISAAQSDSGVRAIVLRGAARFFSAGADITEFEKPLTGLGLGEVIDAIEMSSKPVIAAVHGMALGGACEVILGCHYRLATPDARIGLPESTLGFPPGAGGTQRLPRLVGVPAALEMIVTGRPIPASKAADLGLIDKIVDEADLVPAAIAFARETRKVRPTRDLPLAADPAAFAASAPRIKGSRATEACIEAVRAATELPFAQGMAKEQELFVKLVHGAEAQAIRHVFFAERAAPHIIGMPDGLGERPMRSVGVIGAGTMGSAIAMNFMTAGIPCTILDASQDMLDRGLSIIRENFTASVAKGRITREQLDRAFSFLTPATDLEQLRDCDLVIEAAYEDMSVKKDIFRRLDAAMKPGAILASNTSFLSIDDIAAATRRPQDVVGLHFFSPANIMKLIEVVRGDKTASDVLAACMKLGKRLGKIPVLSGMCHGFIGNRMLLPRQDNAMQLLLAGATPSQVDAVHLAFGMPMGPFQMADLAGVDLGWHRDPSRVETVQEALCAAGRWGQKTKAGFYDYDDTRRSMPSAAVATVIEAFRDQMGVVPREISDEEILVRTLFTLINEGVKILEEGIAQRASDIDVVWVNGYGWPRQKGGPMFWADQIGAAALVQALAKFQDELGRDFTVAPLLLACAEKGSKIIESRPRH